MRSSMRVHLRYFAALREVTSRDGEEVELPAGATPAAARDLLVTRYPTLAGILPRCAVAINRAYSPAHAALRDGDELAFIPPLGGGASSCPRT